jgi:uncharacterized membrane protein
MRLRNWAPIGSFLAIGIVGALLTAEALAGFRSLSGGDMVLAPSLAAWLSLTILIVANVVRQRRRHTRLRARRVGARDGQSSRPEIFGDAG